MKVSQRKFWTIMATIVLVPLILFGIIYGFIESSKIDCQKCHLKNKVILTYSVHSCVASGSDFNAILPILPNMGFRYSVSGSNPVDPQTGESLSTKDGWRWFCSRDISDDGDIGTKYCGYNSKVSW